MSAAVLLLSAAACLCAIGKGLFRPLIERAGDRLAGWLLPAERVWTYRLARAVGRVCEVIAPTDTDKTSRKTSAVWFAIEGVLADIDEIELGDHGGARLAVSLAWSLVRPALATRLIEVMRWLWRAVFAFPAYCAWCIASKAVGATFALDDPGFGPRSRGACIAIVVGANVAAVVGIRFVVPVAPVIGIVAFGWAALQVVIADVMAVREHRYLRKARELNERWEVLLARARDAPRAKS